MRRILFSTLVLFAVAGCKQIEISNGEIPDQYLALAKTYLKDYHGSFEGNKGDLHFALNGKKLVVTFTGQVNDITGNEDCASQIGDLSGLQLNDEGTQIEGLSFDFSANRCFYIQGKSLNLIFNDSGINATILKEVRPIQICGLVSPPAPNPIPVPRPPVCHTDYQYYYLGGGFSK